MGQNGGKRDKGFDKKRISKKIIPRNNSILFPLSEEKLRKKKSEKIIITIAERKSVTPL